MFAARASDHRGHRDQRAFHARRRELDGGRERAAGERAAQPGKTAVLCRRRRTIELARTC